MRKTILIFLLLFSVLCFSQYGNGTVYLKNGTAMIGFISNTSDTNVTFKTRKKSKEKIKFPSTEVDSLVFTNDKFKSKWIYSIVYRSISTYKLLHVLVEGELSLYTSQVNYYNRQPTSTYYYNNQSAPTYYFGKNKRITNIFGKNFKKKRAIENYFYDCPKIIELVNKEAFKKYVKNQKDHSNENRFIHMVNYYNTHCK